MGASACIECPLQHHSIGNASACDACHDGANCSAGIFRGTKRGWWWRRQEEADAGQSSGGGDGLVSSRRGIHECVPTRGLLPERCVGGLVGGESGCASEYSGNLCARCANGYYLSSRLFSPAACMPCNGNSSHSLARIYAGVANVTAGFASRTIHRILSEGHGPIWLIALGVVELVLFLLLLLLLVGSRFLFCCASFVDEAGNESDSGHAFDVAGSLLELLSSIQACNRRVTDA